MGETARLILAIATVEKGPVLKILYEAGRRRAPGSHRLGPAGSAPPSPAQQPPPPPRPPPPPAPPPPHNAARARLGRSREAARTLAGRKVLATCATDAARAILTEGSRPLFPFLLCEGRLSSETPRFNSCPAVPREALI
ncbi:uncharacterized protein LOC143269080 [Peromyscus maniculatus bairdii]|uniref:uncharacterized protein LOC143269080 n=1 Tax=Peromyscus maniculatus bairdii TaxID=230844 RepID=UPI003FD4D1CA